MIGTVWDQDAWAADTWADGAWAEGSDAPNQLGDLTTLFAGYVDDLLLAAGGGDVDTLVSLDQPDVRAAVPEALRDDLNTVYARYLS